MYDLGNIERISIPGAYDYDALAKMYIVNNDSALAGRLQDELITHFNPGKYTAPFSFEILDSADSITHNAIAETVKERDYLAIIQILDNDAPTFLACRRMNDTFKDFLSIANLLYLAEQEFKSLLPDIVFGAVPISGMMGILPMASAAISFCGRKGKGTEKADKNELEEAKKDFVENVLKYQSGDTNALSKIEMVIKSMSDAEKNKILSDYIKTMAKEGANSFHKKYIDTNNILNSSKVTVWVKRCNTCSGNDGYFRIFYKYEDKDFQQFEFQHKESCIIFLMHLLYNRQNGNIRKNMILDKNNEEPFVSIFMKVYDITEKDAAARYQNMMDTYDDVSKKQIAQGRLKDFISDCNKSVDSCLLPLDESPYPLKIKRNGYMPILNSKVHFDDASLKELQYAIA